MARSASVRANTRPARSPTTIIREGAGADQAAASRASKCRGVWCVAARVTVAPDDVVGRAVACLDAVPGVRARRSSRSMTRRSRRNAGRPTERTSTPEPTSPRASTRFPCTSSPARRGAWTASLRSWPPLGTATSCSPHDSSCWRSACAAWAPPGSPCTSGTNRRRPGCGGSRCPSARMESPRVWEGLHRSGGTR
jgi:hypothetical protein